KKNKQKSEPDIDVKKENNINKWKDKLSKQQDNQEATNDQGMTNYNFYTYKTHEYILISLIVFAILFAVGFVFYQNIILAGVIGLAGFYYPKLYKKTLIKKRKAELSRQFQ